MMTLASLGMLALALMTRPEVIVLDVLAAALVVVYGIATFVPFKPWGWTLALLAIALGLPNVSAVFAIPLLVFWLKPSTKAAFALL